MRDVYAWIPWFDELCGKIAEGGESELARRAREVRWKVDGNDSPLLRYGDANIDPFSFLYTLATGCKHPEGRRRLCDSVGRVFELATEMPVEVEEAFIFPMGVPMNALFHAAGRGNPSLLWHLLHSAREGADTVSAADFDAALAIGNVGFPKLTQTLFLINPSEFMPYDDGTRKLLVDTDPGAKDWEGYRSAVGRFHDEFPGCGLHEVNLLAFLLSSEEISLGSAAYQISTNVRGDSVDRWDEFDEANAVWTGGPGSGVDWETPAEGVQPARSYPLQSPERGDLILVRYGGQGRGIGVVHRNGYREDLSEDERLDVIWVNRSAVEVGNFDRQKGFTRAYSIADAFFACNANEAMTQDYILMARVNGFSRARIVGREALRNALVPTLKLAGVQLTFLVGGTVLVEKIFSYPGIGNMAIDAVINRDLPLIQGLVLTFAVLFITVNLLVDMSYALLEPRMRHG